MNFEALNQNIFALVQFCTLSLAIELEDVMIAGGYELILFECYNISLRVCSKRFKFSVSYYIYFLSKS